MKRTSILWALLLALANLSQAQSFTAETLEMFLTDKETELMGGIDVKSGVLKKSDKLEIYAETGRKFSATILSIQGKDYQEMEEVRPGEYAFFTLKFEENPSSGKDYLRKGYKVYPSGFVVEVANIKAAAENDLSKEVRLNAKLDGKAFRARVTYKGASLFRNGVKGIVEKPFLQLQFACVDAPDDRLLTIQIFNPKEGKAKYSAKDMEVNFSGTTDGVKENATIFGFVNGKATPNFTLEITQWQASGNKATISGKISGDLPEVKIFGKSQKVNRFENGVFDNVEVELINEQIILKGN